MTNWAIVPVKHLDCSKSRLADVLSAHDRQELICNLLIRTLNILTASEFIENTIVISEDETVLRLAVKQGIFTLKEDSPSDLNSALHQATLETISHGATGLLILPADLPLLDKQDVEKMTGTKDSDRMVLIVPDQHGVGTNALFVRPPGMLRYQFGQDSLSAHKQEANRLRGKLYICRLPNVEFDIDDPDDLMRLEHVALYTQKQEVQGNG